MMMVEIKKDFMIEYMNQNNLTKMQFIKQVHISSMSFNKIMQREKVGLMVGIKLVKNMCVEDKYVFDWNFKF